MQSSMGGRCEITLSTNSYKCSISSRKSWGVPISRYTGWGFCKQCRNYDLRFHQLYGNDPRAKTNRNFLDCLSHAEKSKLYHELHPIYRRYLCRRIKAISYFNINILIAKWLQLFRVATLHGSHFPKKFFCHLFSPV